ncbi:MAG: hypothetical protein AB8H79_01730 [Myxococcota bacterium]
MKRMMWVGLTLALAGCGDDGVFGNIGGGGGGDNGIGAVDVPNTAELMQTLEGDLKDGAAAIDIGFLEDHACVPATQNEKFNGNIVWYTYDQPAERQVYVVVDPASGVDVSLVVSQATAGSGAEGEEGVTDLCETGLDYDSPNAGGEESAKVTSVSKPYDVIIGVAGAFGEVEGEYTLEIFEE